jgi:hypothetical protein
MGCESEAGGGLSDANECEKESAQLFGLSACFILRTSSFNIALVDASRGISLRPVIEAHPNPLQPIPERHQYRYSKATYKSLSQSTKHALNA